MLRCTPASLGRWSSRDFMRGRSKRGGAVHTRHTHGRQGRYKRLSTHHSSIRDGRRHVANHMQGGLGIKLGGGLFGLRIPRQHQLSTLSKEDYDLEMHGHPNITNPYREHLDEHPDLKSVMMNAAVAVQVVVLMPRVARSRDGERGEKGGIPKKWGQVVEEASAALHFLMPPLQPFDASPLSSASPAAVSRPPAEVHFTTVENSICCRWPPTTAPHASSLEAEMEACVAQLYSAHCRLRQTLRLEKVGAKAVSSLPASSSGDLLASLPRRGRRPAVFMGSALKTPFGGSSVCSSEKSITSSVGSFTSSVLAQLTRDAASSSSVIARGAALDTDTVAAAADNGLISVVRRLSSTEVPTLRVCLCPTKAGSGSTHGTAAAAASSSPPITAPPRSVLKADIDPNAAVGVWCLPPSPLQELLRWHYCAHDPRAHNHDALPHHRRSLPLLLVVDYSTVDLSHTAYPGVVHATLMPRRLSLELETAGFRVVEEQSLRDVAKVIAQWSPSAQWDRLTQPVPASVTRDGDGVCPHHPCHRHNHESACASC